MPCYTLWLSTLITSPSSNYVVAINSSNLANASWRVDFDNLFGEKASEYKFCRLRFNLAGETFTASVPASNDWTNYNGYLSVSLPSSYQACTTNGTILGIISPTDSPISGTSVHCMLSSTLSECGVDINVPTGVQQVNIQMMSWSNNQFFTTMQNYAILLNFELYN